MIKGCSPCIGRWGAACYPIASQCNNNCAACRNIFCLARAKALGVEAVNLVPASSRGAAVGAYSLFIDLSLGITGPLAGAIAAGFGFASIFLFAAFAALSGLGLSVYLYKHTAKYREV